MLADFGSSGGWWIKVEVEDNHAFFTKAMVSEFKAFHSDVVSLPSSSIEAFKTKWGIDKLIELHYSPCGQHAFSIVDEKYVQE